MGLNETKPSSNSPPLNQTILALFYLLIELWNDF